MRELAASLACALDPVAFAESLGFAPDSWQANVLRSTGKRLLLNCSRQAGKSTTAAVLALHCAIYFQASLILLVSPSLRQSSELFRKVIEGLDKLPNKPEVKEDNKTTLTLGNGSRIVSLPGSEGTVRGYSGATLIIEDEASRVDDALYYSVRPMLAVSGGRLILMSTPFGKRGHFHAEWTGQGSWGRVQIPATECPRISQAFLDEERAALGEWWFRQEYLCEFSETTDSLFSYEQISAAFDDKVQPLFASNGGLPGITTAVQPLQIGVVS